MKHNLLLEFERLANTLSQRKMAYNMRVRFNPHHPKKDREYEYRKFHHTQSKDWVYLKNLYVNNRESIIAEAKSLVGSKPTLLSVRRE